MTGQSTANLPSSTSAVEVLGHDYVGSKKRTVRIPISAIGNGTGTGGTTDQSVLDAIDGLSEGLETKASLPDFNTLAGRVTTIEGNVPSAAAMADLLARVASNEANKADMTAFTVLLNQVADLETSKADTASFNGLLDRLTAVEGGKADQSSVKELADDLARFLPELGARPGDRPELFTSRLIGDGIDAPKVAEGAVVTADEGRVLRVTKTEAAPTIIAARVVTAVEAGHVYAARWTVQRIQNTTDPSGDAVQMGIVMLDKDRNLLAEHIVSERSLVTADSLVSDQLTFARDQPADYTVNANTRYIRPFVRVHGGDGVTDIIVVHAYDGSTGVPGPKGEPGDATAALEALRDQTLQAVQSAEAAETGAGNALAAANLATVRAFDHFYLDDLDFVFNDDGSAAKGVNDDKWAQLMADYAKRPLMLITDGFLNGDNGFHAFDRIAPLAIHSTQAPGNAGFIVKDPDIIPFRVRGEIGGAHMAGFIGTGLVFEGGFAAAGYPKWDLQTGTKPHPNVGDSSWAGPSCWEALYCDNIFLTDCIARNGVYDGFSLPRDISGARLVNCHAEFVGDDLVNAGGFNVSTDPFVVAGVQIINCTGKYGRNAGFHLSGGAESCSILGGKIEFCGRHGADTVAANNHISSVTFENIGQPKAANLAAMGWPFDPYDGVPTNRGGCGFVVAGPPTHPQHRCVVENITVRNLFDRLGRQQSALRFQGSGGQGVEQLTVTNMVLDNTTQTAGYDSSNISALSGDAGWSATDSRIEITDFYDPARPGGRMDLPSNSRTALKLRRYDVAGDSSGVAATVSGDDLYLDLEISGSGPGVTVTGDNARFPNLKLDNTNPRGSVVNGLRVAGENAQVDKLFTRNVRCDTTSTTASLFIDEWAYIGDAAQKARILTFEKGTMEVRRMHVEQARLVGTSIDETCMKIGAPNLKIGRLTGHNYEIGGTFIKLNSTSAEGFTLPGGEFHCRNIFKFETVAVPNVTLTGMCLTTLRASGIDIYIKGERGRHTGIDIKRLQSYATAPISVSSTATSSVVANNTALGVTGSSAVSGSATGTIIDNNLFVA